MAKQLHKRFSTEEVKALFEKGDSFNCSKSIRETLVIFPSSIKEKAQLEK